MASTDARFLPEERNYTLIDALGLAQGGDSSLLHDLKSGHFCRLMGVVGIHDLARGSAEAFDIVGHVPNRRVESVLYGTVGRTDAVH